MARVIGTCDGELLYRTIQPNDIVLSTDAQQVRQLRYGLSSRCMHLYFARGTVSADCVVGTIDGVTGTMTTLWHLSVRPFMMRDAGIFDNDVRAPIRRTLLLDPMTVYRTPFVRSSKCTYSVDGLQEYSLSAWTTRWARAYAVALERVPLYQMLKQMLAEDETRLLFIYGKAHRRTYRSGVISLTWTRLKYAHAAQCGDTRWVLFLLAILNKQHI